jgi:hypothetical protein
VWVRVRSVRGQASAQLDITLIRGRLRPVVFIDAGQRGALTSCSGARLVGGGVGLSLFGGYYGSTQPSDSPDTGGKLRLTSCRG